jgi:tocopherol O-methyltransferase
MIADPSITKTSIRDHYNLATPFYRLFWGQHIHHGLWDNGAATPKQAQRRLIDRLAAMARLGRGQTVLDVGCGMGGSTIDLASRFGCRATGVTLSRVQRIWATMAAAMHGVGERTRFRCADAEKVQLPPRSFDVVWIVECSEHLFDKPEFFRRVATWLKPGGRVAIAAWLAGDGPGHEPHVQAVCKYFLCPSLASAEDYLRWFRDAGMVREAWEDVTGSVEQTWDICGDRVRRSGVRRIAPFFGRDIDQFLNHFTTLREAYRIRAMRYGLFTAQMPA